jgi:hypothetical protein
MPRLTDYEFGQIKVDGLVRPTPGVAEALATRNPAAVAAALHLTC